MSILLDLLVYFMLWNTGSIYAHKLLDIISGVCYLHSEGFVHGDLRAVGVYSFKFVTIVRANLG
jgi:hypothetical protein